MKKRFTTATVLLSLFMLKEADAQVWQKPAPDSTVLKNAETQSWRDTSFHCNFGGNIPVLTVYPGRQNRSGFKNQNLRIISNRDFRNMDMKTNMNAYSYF